MINYSFEIPGVPVPKGRPRMTKSGHAYTPQQTRDYDAWVRLCWLQTGQPMSLQPLQILLKFYLPIPKSFRKKQRELALAGVLLPTKKPDIDNLVKAVLDGLNGLAYQDDKQIVALEAAKGYEITPLTRVTLREVEQDDR